MLSVLFLPAAARAAEGTMSAAAATPAGKNMVWNGAFDSEHLRPWSVMFDSARFGSAAVTAGELCFKLAEPSVHGVDVVLRQRPIALAKGHHYQIRFKTHATAPTKVRARLSKISVPYTEMWGATVDADATAKTYTGTYDGIADDDSIELAIEFGGPLTGKVPLTVCLDDVELNDPAFEPPVAQARPASAVRVNQVGYLPGFAKIATVATKSATPVDWHLVDKSGKVRASGKTRPFGEDKSSGEQVQQIDFSSFTAPGKGYKLKVGKDESLPFDVGNDVYKRLKHDALAFFYLQRSGVPIKMPYAGSKGFERAAGHTADKSVPCSKEAKCDYSLDVSGGWYDAGDHGKYLVNGGFSVWALQNEYESLQKFGSTAGDFGDGKLNIPEGKNSRPDILDEARFGLEALMGLQVPAGKPMAGMAHQKMHGDKWSAIPTAPDKDEIKRYLRPVSTAATLNLAAAAAQAARIWKTMDPAFSKRCLDAAENAYAAALKNPKVAAEPKVEGGGIYGDGDTGDEFYWAATELYITTGKENYKTDLAKSRFHTPKAGVETMAGELGWDHVAPAAKMSLVAAPNGLGDPAIAAIRAQLVAAADRFVGTIAKRGYRVPMASDVTYIWGSNGAVMSAAVVLGTAYNLTHDAKYANAVIDCMDYLLGRNPLAFSYVSGYGTHALRNPHHRVWAHMKDAKLPEAPPGAVSGGPNSTLQDPYIRKLGMSGCPPETCYVDNIESYSTNEVAINWNATLAWMAAFLDDIGHKK
ncbi:MAG TPA: glycoside hydrolase family 9 protein [Polyangia bacterium]|nr:glycoside hydrolase family 9 protein [Polyangia bacterium]